MHVHDALEKTLGKPKRDTLGKGDLREKVWRTFVNRGDNGDARDNNAIISEILQLRAERAKLKALVEACDAVADAAYVEDLKSILGTRAQMGEALRAAKEADHG